MSREATGQTHNTSTQARYESKANAAAATAANVAANATYPACPAEIVAATSTAATASTTGAVGLHLTLLVVGKVTDSCGRVLIEILEGGEAVSATLTCTQIRVRNVDAPALSKGADGVADEKKQSPDPPSSSASAASQSAPAAQGDTLPPPVTVTQKLMPGRPRIFVFHGLRENAHYSLTIAGLAHPQPANAGFTTMMKDWKVDPSFPPMRLVTVSCNLLSETLALKKEQTDLWSDMADRVQRGEVDYVLHMGDQVYADEPRSNGKRAALVSAFAPKSHAKAGEGRQELKDRDQLVFTKCMRLLEKSGATTAEEYAKLHPQMEELYRVLYRETWSHPPTARVLATVPNLTIYDDHDFVDNWGTLPEHHQRDSKEFAIGWCARQVYYEYQAVLHRDIERLEDVPLIQDDHHMHVFGEYGIVFTESRGALSFRYKGEAEKAPFLGSSQWKDIDAALSPGGLMDGVKHLVFVCPCPVVYLPPLLNAMCEPMVEDAQGHWASAPFIAEQTHLLNLALAWQERDAKFGETLREREPPVKPDGIEDPLPERGVLRTSYPSLVGRPVKNATSGVQQSSLLQSDRRLTFVGGDVHVGGHTRIYKHGHLVLEQLVSSAIANHILPSLAFQLGQLLQNALTDLEDGWSFQHQPYTRFRNYGIVECGYLAGDKKPSVTTHIISAE